MVVYIIFLAELSAFLLIVRNILPTLTFFLPKKLNLVSGLLFFFAGLTIFRFIFLFIQNLSLTSVFLTGDVLDSWNPWAVQWLQNQLPHPTFHYPQLITANWSLTYIFMQTTQIQLFAKLLMTCFVPLLLLIFVDLFQQTKKMFYLIALVITGVLFHYYFDGSFLREGYVDIAFAFFAFLPFYFWLLYGKTKNKEYLFMMLISALGSFLTKQLGIYIVLLALITPPGCITAYYNSLKNKKIKRFSRIIIFTVILFFTICLWWTLKFNEVLTTINIETIYHSATNYAFVNKPLVARFTHDLSLLAPNYKGIILVTLVILTQISALFNKRSLKIIVFVIVPFFVFWTLFLNYDQRNLAAIFPYLGFTAAVGLHYNQLINCSKKKWQSILSAKNLFLLGLAIVLICNLFINDQKLLSEQNEGKKQIGIPKLNSRLYNYYNKSGFQGKIATNYYRLCNLPEIGKYCFYSQQSSHVERGLSNETPLRRGSAGQAIKYYLYPENFAINIETDYQIIFRDNGWVFAAN